jgi:uncharacterized YccA/Bax inhibitor family protein
MRSSNPMLRKSILEETYALTDRPMTISGTMTKLLLLSLVMLCAAGAVYYQFSLGRLDFVNTMMTVGIVVSFIVGLIISFKKTTAPYLSPIYAFTQGAVISGVSCMFNTLYDGIVMQAISITFLVVFVMALLFKFGVLRATEKFKVTILVATASIAVFYLVSFILMLCNINVPYFTSTSPVAILVNFVIACVAALNLIIDFDFIESGSRSNLPSYFEWYGAFGLLVTILWLYIEILRLLARSSKK